MVISGSYNHNDSLTPNHILHINRNLVIFSFSYDNLILLVILMLLMKVTKLEEFCTSCSVKDVLKKQTPKIQELLTIF